MKKNSLSSYLYLFIYIATMPLMFIIGLEIIKRSTGMSINISVWREVQLWLGLLITYVSVKFIPFCFGKVVDIVLKLSGSKKEEETL